MQLSISRCTNVRSSDLYCAYVVSSKLVGHASESRSCYGAKRGERKDPLTSRDQIVHSQQAGKGGERRTLSFRKSFLQWPRLESQAECVMYGRASNAFTRGSHKNSGRTPTVSIKPGEKEAPLAISAWG